MNPILTAYGVSYNYGETQVLKDVSLELFPKQFIALLGPNGSGKSTLLKILSGLIPLDVEKNSGLIKLRGQNLRTLDSYRRAQIVVYISSEICAEFPMTAYDAVSLGFICQNAAFSLQKLQKFQDHSAQGAIHEVMEKCFCWGFRERALHTLSGGEKQLVLLARALLQGAKVLLIDEGMSRMDLHHQYLIGNMLSRLVSEGYTVVLVAHDLNLATEWAETCIVLNQGVKTTEGLVSEVIREDKIQALFPGGKFKVGVSPVSGKSKVFFA